MYLPANIIAQSLSKSFIQISKSLSIFCILWPSCLTYLINSDFWTKSWAANIIFLISFFSASYDMQLVQLLKTYMNMKFFAILFPDSETKVTEEQDTVLASFGYFHRFYLGYWCFVLYYVSLTLQALKWHYCLLWRH